MRKGVRPPAAPLVVTSNNVSIDAGSNYELPLPITTAGTVVRWQFELLTPGSDIGFKISHVSGGKHTVLMAPERRSASKLEGVSSAAGRGMAGGAGFSGTVETPGPGTCALLWQNDYSWWKSKLISYRVEVIAPGQMSAASASPRALQSGGALRSTSAASSTASTASATTTTKATTTATSLSTSGANGGVSPGGGSVRVVEVDAPPGPLGLDLTARASTAGVVVRRVHAAALAKRISPGARLMSVDGQDCATLGREQVVQLVRASAERQRRLVFHVPGAASAASASASAAASASASSNGGDIGGARGGNAVAEPLPSMSPSASVRLLRCEYCLEVHARRCETLDGGGSSNSSGGADAACVSAFSVGVLSFHQRGVPSQPEGSRVEVRSWEAGASLPPVLRRGDILQRVDGQPVSAAAEATRLIDAGCAARRRVQLELLSGTVSARRASATIAEASEEYEGGAETDEEAPAATASP